MDDPKPEDQELDNFLSKVTEVGDLIQGLNSVDENEVKRANMKADIYLHETELDENRDLTVLCNRTVINQKAFDRIKIGAARNEQDNMDPETFMKVMERDADQRYKSKLKSKKLADEFQAEGNEAFRRKDYITALDRYTKALNEVKDRAMLYCNRALTHLHLRLYTKAVTDADKALSIAEDSQRALAYKGLGLSLIPGREEEGEVCLDRAYALAQELHAPTLKAFVKDFKSQHNKSSEQIPDE